jgi:hypothetical protein
MVRDKQTPCRAPLANGDKLSATSLGRDALHALEFI